MSDRYFGEILIPQHLITEDVKKEIEEYFSWGYNDKDFDILRYSNSEARNGQFEELESLLKENKIPFDRYSSAYTDCSAETRYYRPETDNEPEIDTTVYEVNGGYSFITTNELKKLLQMTPLAAYKELDRLIKINDPDIKPLTDYTLQDVTDKVDKPVQTSSSQINSAALPEMHELLTITDDTKMITEMNEEYIVKEISKEDAYKLLHEHGYSIPLGNRLFRSGRYFSAISNDKARDIINSNLDTNYGTNNAENPLTGNTPGLVCQIIRKPKKIPNYSMRYYIYVKNTGGI